MDIHECVYICVYTYKYIYSHSFDLLNAAIGVWRVAAKESAEERAMSVKMRAADIFWSLRSWTRCVLVWKEALRVEVDCVHI